MTKTLKIPRSLMEKTEIFKKINELKERKSKPFSLYNFACRISNLRKRLDYIIARKKFKF